MRVNQPCICINWRRIGFIRLPLKAAASYFPVEETKSETFQSIIIASSSASIGPSGRERNGPQQPITLDEEGWDDSRKHPKLRGRFTQRRKGILEPLWFLQGTDSREESKYA